MNKSVAMKSLGIIFCLHVGVGCSFQGSTAISGRSGKVSGQPSGTPQPSGANPDETPSDADAVAAQDQADLPGTTPGEGLSGESPNPQGSPNSPGSPGSSQGGRPGNPTLPSTKDPASLGLVESLVWKRYRPLELTLMQALDLTKAQVCQELGQFSCIDTVHLTILGGNEPYINGQYERADRPTVLTPLTTERVVLAACNQRLTLDKAAPTQKAVFKHLDLTAASATADQIKKQSIELYQRFYARDPSPQEVTASLEIAKILTAPEKLALGLCLAIGSTIENVFL